VNPREDATKTARNEIGDLFEYNLSDRYPKTRLPKIPPASKKLDTSAI
jgi:hypothetical protein